MTPGPRPGTDVPPPAPVAPRRPAPRSLHGVEDEDEYRWMRDHDAPDLLAALAAERAYHDAATAHLAPLRDELYAAMAARLAPVEESVEWEAAGWTYRERSAPDADYPALCRRPAGAPREAEVVVLDPGVEGRGHAHVEVGVREVSPDGRWLAWSLDTTGDEVYRLRFRDLAAGTDLPDVLPRTYYTGAWLGGAAAFVYCVHDETYRPYSVRRHVLGTDPARDTELFREDDRAYEVTVRATRSGGLVVIRSANRDTSECHVMPAGDVGASPSLVRARRRGVQYDVDHLAAVPGGPAGGRLVAVTDAGAREFRVLSRDLPAGWATGGGPVGGGRGDEGADGGVWDGWHELVAGRDDVRVLDVEPFAGHLVLTVRRDGRPALEVREHDGTLRRVVTAPVAEGSVRLGPHEEYAATRLTVEAESLVAPRAWWDVDAADGSRSPRLGPQVPGWEADRYVTRRLTVTAGDGVEVPVTVAHHRDTRVDGTAPCLLYGYGSYEAVCDPEFDVPVSVLLDRGWVYAVAHLRGGGELGRDWWLQGRLERKPTTFTDFVAVGRGLVARGYAAAGRLAARGQSAGGLLVGAAVGLAPDLWRAVLAEVPFVDVVGSMLDDTVPLTVIEWDEWGDPRRPEHFVVMRGYSPYDNPPPGPRPDLLVTGSLHDSRVLVHEPAAWVARLRATQPDDRQPHLLFRAELGEGAHSGPGGRFARLRYEAEVLAWLAERLEGPGPAPAGPAADETVGTGA